MDLLVLLLLWVAFAALVTLQVALAFTIGQRLGKLRGWLCLLAFPLVPYFGGKAGARAWSVIWLLLLVSYLALLYFATR